MALKPVTGGERSYVKYKECVEGQVLAEGTYMGQIDGKFGPQHLVRKSEGGEVVLNSSGHLNYLLESHVQKGDYIQVKYAGTAILEKGRFEGKESHQFVVLKDDSKESSVREAEVVNMRPAENASANQEAAEKAKSAAQALLDSEDESDEDLEDAAAILAKYRS